MNIFKKIKGWFVSPKVEDVKDVEGCLITLEFDGERFYYGAEWPEGDEEMFGVMLAKINSGAMLTELLSVIQEGCENMDKPEQYSNIMFYFMQHFGSDTVSQPIIKPSEVFNAGDNNADFAGSV